MKLEKISSYKKLDKAIVNIVLTQNEPVTADYVGTQLIKNYEVTNNLNYSNRAIGVRLTGHPNIRVLRGRRNRYTLR